MNSHTMALADVLAQLERLRPPKPTIVLPDTEEFDMHELTLWAEFGEHRINVIRSEHVEPGVGYLVNHDAIQKAAEAAWSFDR